MNIEINTEDFWDALTGADFGNCQDFVTVIGRWESDVPSGLAFTHLNKDDDGESETYLTLEQMKAGYVKALENGDSHCGESLNLDDPDACFAYIVLQYALYGEVVFG